MFLDFYQLREQPFDVTPDPRFLYLSQTHREALASLVYGIEAGRGFMALIGQSGMGKTTLLFQLLERWRSSALPLYLFQTQCNSRELLRFLLAESGKDPDEQDLLRMQSQLNEVLLSEARAGRRVLLFIDEAQNLENSVLETVRLLSDFETPSRKLLQIVLAGQPPLAKKLAHPSLIQLRQRIAIISRLHPLPPEEIGHYIDYRLMIAGYKGTPLFTSDARAMLVQQSRGIPRNINNLCFNAMSLGYALNHKTIDASILREVVADLDVESLVPEHDTTHRVASPDTPAASQPLRRADLDTEPFVPNHRAVLRFTASDSPAASKTSPPWPERLRNKWVVFVGGMLAALLTLAGSFSINKKAVEVEAKKTPSPVNAGQTSSPRGQALTVVVEPNQTLAQISLRYLGRLDLRLMEEIRMLNPDLKDPNVIKIGQQIRLPLKSNPSLNKHIAANGSAESKSKQEGVGHE
jgi:type II secretory pathway predicted ATPase ExeA/LysM repeat protein